MPIATVKMRSVAFCLLSPLSMFLLRQLVPISAKEWFSSHTYELTNVVNQQETEGDCDATCSKAVREYAFALQTGGTPCWVVDSTICLTRLRLSVRGPEQVLKPVVHSSVKSGVVSGKNSLASLGKGFLCLASNALRVGQSGKGSRASLHSLGCTPSTTGNYEKLPHVISQKEGKRSRELKDCACFVQLEVSKLLVSNYYDPRDKKGCGYQLVIHDYRLNILGWQLIKQGLGGKWPKMPDYKKNDENRIDWGAGFPIFDCQCAKNTDCQQWKVLHQEASSSGGTGSAYDELR